MTDADVVVVGGGPAGLATAIRARMAGLSVVVLERSEAPVDRACGEGIMPDGVAELDAMGVRVAACRAFAGIRYVDGGLEAEGRFPGPPGIGVRRTVLHEALIRRAGELGAELRFGTGVTGLTAAGVAIEGGELRASWVVGADGRTSKVRSWAGLNGRSHRPGRFGLRRHFRLPPWTDLVEVHWHDAGEAYVTPVADDLVGIALIWHGPRLAFERMLGCFPELARRVAGAPEASRELGGGPFGQRARRPAEGRVALVGDASCCVDPISGAGVTLALHEAAALADAMSHGDLGRYRAAHARLRRVPVALAGLLEQAAHRPSLRRRLLKALAASRTLFDDALAVGTGARSLSLLGRGGAANLAWELARHAV